MTNLPRSTGIAFPIIREILQIGWVDMPDHCQGDGAPGHTLEFLLDVRVNNLDSPDLQDWEVKFKWWEISINLIS